MLRLRSSILAHLLSSSPTASPASTLHRLISAAAPAIPPNPSGFAVEEYLVSTCGLTQAQAVKASAKISHLKSPAKPDAVLAFLTGLGLSGADVAALVAKDPRFLCAGVERVLAPNIAALTAPGYRVPSSRASSRSAAPNSVTEPWQVTTFTCIVVLQHSHV
ncbi:uncharacterized protein LOC123413335 [Hordeum vulgare subsp. vulgare]|uniref:uncharacterized protein LOC123413335 n=1 Tax=Hordeum vulgare subsp. vulgare TaxID=112509 RepID=UPI000B46134B|nr:uncharacterized protein LOC123413335 [Hordeum vulgare subsp. vulgare]